MQQVYNIKSTFGLFALQRHGMHGLKLIDTKSFLQNPDGNQQLNTKQRI